MSSPQESEVVLRAMRSTGTKAASDFARIRRPDQGDKAANFADAITWMRDVIEAADVLYWEYVALRDAVRRLPDELSAVGWMHAPDMVTDDNLSGLCLSVGGTPRDWVSVSDLRRAIDALVQEDGEATETPRASGAESLATPGPLSSPGVPFTEAHRDFLEALAREAFELHEDDVTLKTYWSARRLLREREGPHT